jgi:hypothetical protein
MGVTDVSPGGPADTVLNSVWSRVHVERDSLLRRKSDGHIDDYYNWYWTSMTRHSFFVPTPGAISGDSAHVVLNGRTGGLGYIGLTVNGQPGSRLVCNSYSCSYVSYALFDGLNSVELDLTPDGSTPPYFDNLSLTYHRSLTPENNRLDIVIEDVQAIAEVRVTDNFSSAPFLLDVTDPLNPVELTGYAREGGLVSFRADLSGAEFKQYQMMIPQNAASPISIELTSPVDLRGSSVQTDLFVIAPEIFIPYLSDYEAYREVRGYALSVVTVEAIMDNFAYGLYDPVAIRDFLKYSYDACPSPRPSAVLLVGDASYDFRNLLGTNVPNYVPSCIHPKGNLDESYSDDNYVYFGKYGLLDSDTSRYRVPDRGLDMMTSRWPVEDPAEIAVIVGKIKNYESASNFGFWRTSISLVADDEFGGAFDNETFHTTQTEELEREKIPRVFTRDKIYLWEYPFVGREKPAVNEAIIRSLNEGRLIVNYVGHGNPDVWAHEHVLRRSTDLPRLSNYERLPLVFAASCAIGFFYDPKREGMGEDFLTLSSGGAVGVVSATRLVYSQPNASFNRDVFELLLGESGLSVCEAVYAAKLARQYSIVGTDTIISTRPNDRAFVHFGDPYMKLGVPDLDVEFTKVPDSLVALGQSRVEGRVVDEYGAVLQEDGTLLISVYDSEREKTYRVDDETIDYSVTGPGVYRGSATITAGEFGFDFVTPLDIGYGGRGARLVAYAVFDSVDAVGLIDSILVSEVITASTDADGPVIEYSFAGRTNFISGDAITTRETLEVTLSDSSGINLAGGLGHGISLEIDGRAENTVMLTELFEFDQDDFTRGSLTHPLEGLEPGWHTFKIKAWDNANNSSTIQFAADVVGGGILAINNLLNYPNPMSERTTFYFELTQQVNRFCLDIFTLSGRKIKSFSSLGLPADNYPNGTYSLTWDGRDADGDRVATGVYIYRASALPSTGSEQVECFGKVVVVN